MTDHKGELRLCSEGQRLYDEYCRILDDSSYEAFGTEFVDAWTAWRLHRLECDSCGYV